MFSTDYSVNREMIRVIYDWLLLLLYRHRDYPSWFSILIDNFRDHKYRTVLQTSNSYGRVIEICM